MGIDENGLTLTVAEGSPERTVRSFLRGERSVSSRLIRKAIYGGGALYVNGAPARFVDRVGPGDVVRLCFPDEESYFEPQGIPVSVIYEDGDILAIDKQPGLVVHPTKGHKDGTVANGIARHMQERGERYKVRFVNRLDMDTSGVLLCGKNAFAQSDFTRQAAAGLVEKTYIAAVEGRLLGKGSVDAPIALEAPGLPRRCVREEGGQPSVTEWESVAVLDGITIVRCRLLTGRTHQIRVHMAHIGHPVLSDALYGSPCPAIARQALHAESLAFAHPRDGRPLRFEAPMPDDMRAVWGSF